MGFTVVWGDVQIRCQTACDAVSVVGELRGSNPKEVAQRQSDQRRVKGTTDETESSHSSVPGPENPTTPR